MEPSLRDGDWLLVDPHAFAEQSPRVGELVVAIDPRDVTRLLVKRIRSLGPDGLVTIGGDHRAHEDESITVPVFAVQGRPWFRYWPLRRLGML